MWRAQKTLLNPKTIPSFGVLSSILCFFIPLVLELGRGELEGGTTGCFTNWI